jgi:hypothetical protein
MPLLHISFSPSMGRDLPLSVTPSIDPLTSAFTEQMEAVVRHHLARSIGLSFLIVSLMAGADAAAATAPSAEELDAQLYLARLVPVGELYRLNLAHPMQYAHVAGILRRGGHRNLLRRLETARGGNAAAPQAPPPPVPGKIGDLNVLEYLRNDGRSATVSALSTIAGGADETVVTINYRTPNEAPFAYSPEQSAVGSKTKNFRVADTVPLGNAQRGKTIIATATFLVFKRDSMDTYVYSIQDSTTMPQRQCVTAPNYGRNQQSKFCPADKKPYCTNDHGVARPVIGCVWPGAQCNYVARGGTQIPLALSGTIRFDAPLATPLTGQLLLNLQTGNGAALLVPQTKYGSPLPPQFSVDPSEPNVLRYCFTPEDFPNNGFLDANRGGVMIDGTITVNVMVGGSSVPALAKISSRPRPRAANAHWWAQVPHANFRTTK